MEITMFLKNKIINVTYQFLFIIFLIFLSSEITTAQDETDIVETLVYEPDSTIERGLTFNGYPYAYYTPETQLAFGLGGILIFYTSKERELLPSKITGSAYYTTSSQYKVSLNPVFYFFKNKFYLNTPVSFGHFVDKFWGVGNNTNETGNEDYTRDGFSATLTAQIPPVLFLSDRTGLIFEYDNTEISDKKNNAFLINDIVPGNNGAELFGIGTDLVWDTRDNIFFPNSGGYQYFKFMFYPSFNDYVFSLFEIDVRHFEAISQDHIIASNFYFASAIGEIPFYKLPALGGQNRMRGYFEGRYRDKAYTMLQLEYRQYFWWKFGFAVFAGAGDVASDITKFQLKELKYSYGLGLRFLFNKEEKVNLRMDIGFGNDGNSGIYFGLEEAF
jgi:outer membrane protein assembly factor BamA